MRKGLSKVMIFSLFFILGASPDVVLSGEPNTYSSSFPKSSRKVVEEFLSHGEDFNVIQGRIPISKIKRTFEDDKNVQALNRQFERDCLKGSVVPNKAILCSKAVMTLGVLGRAGTENTIMSFIKTNKNSVASVRKAGLFALGYLSNAREHKQPQKELPVRRMETPEFTPAPPTTPPPPVNISEENIPKEIIKCLPQVLRSNYRLSSEDQNTNLCDTSWEVKNPKDRDEIRWGLITLAKTGSREGRQVLENLIQGPPGTSRYAFIQGLIKLHAIASDKYGLLCLNEPGNSVCQ